MSRRIFLFSQIDSLSANVTIQQLLAFDRESNEEITMFINSPGGSVYQMFAIIDTMMMVKSPIKTVVMGIAASAASVIAAVGDDRYITENSEFMIHEVWSLTIGSVSEMEDDVKNAKKLQDRLLTVLSKKSKKTKAEIEKIIKKNDKYLTAKEAVRYGLVDKILSKGDVQSLKLSEHINVPGYEIDVSEEGQSEVQLLKTGKYFHELYGEIVITDAVLNKMVENFNNKVRGIDISIDYTHDNESGENKAACWVKSLEVKQQDDEWGLYASVEFTPNGKKLVEDKEYKYASADFSIDYVSEDGKHSPYVLRGGTLTNRPFIKEMNPIKLSEITKQKEETEQMTKDELIAKLKEEHEIDVTALLEEKDTLAEEKTSIENRLKDLESKPDEKEAEITNLKEELEQVQTKLIENEKESVFNKLVEEGKVIPAQKEKIFNTFAKAEEIEAFYADAKPVVKVKADGSSGNDANGLTDEEMKLVEAGTLTKEEILENRTIKK